jgi:hypothetical protein
MIQAVRLLYAHRQIGWIMLVGALVPFACLLVIWSMAPPFERVLPPVLLPSICIASALVLVGFSTLATYVTKTHVVLKFGIGLYRRAIPLDRIQRVVTARSSWYEGWGVRWTRRGMLYNVGGFDAVQIDLVDGKSLRIGSDEADRLRQAISHALHGLSSR